jgi:DNA-binding CsgD family transcriptional regulator/tetratricopeptide (TPR) repeat protein
MLHVNRPSRVVGRKKEVEVFREAVAELRRSRGSAVWVEGEPGIGKSTVVDVGLDDARRAGFPVLWATADHMSTKIRLRPLLDCLGVRAGASDPRRAAVARFLRRHQADGVESDSVVPVVAEMLIALLDDLCAETPVVLVVDDAQWADDASLLLCGRLVDELRQLPLLLVLTCGGLLRRSPLTGLRSKIRRHGGTVLPIGPLSEDDARAVLTDVAGPEPSAALTAWARRAGGNPFYLTELVTVLAGDGCLDPTPPRDDDACPATLPAAFRTAVRERLSFLPPTALRSLRFATLLGREFTVFDLSLLLDRPPSALAADVHDAVAMGILVESGSHLAFRNPLLGSALYDDIPRAMRDALHHEVARKFVGSHEPLKIAQQLAAGGVAEDPWAREWLLRNVSELSARAPELAVELFQRELDDERVPTRQRYRFAKELVRLSLAAACAAEAVDRGRRALALRDDAEPRGEAEWLLARALHSAGRSHDALSLVEETLAGADVPDLWRGRLLGSLAMLERGVRGDVAAASEAAARALDLSEASGDRFGAAYALVNTWIVHCVRREFAEGLDRLDEALRVVASETEHVELRAFALDGRVFTLQNLDRWDEAEETRRRACELHGRGAGYGVAPPTTTGAVLMYWTGRWDDALAELAASDDSTITYFGLRERGPALLRYGVTALIACRRGDRRTAADALRRGLAIPLLTPGDRENSDFLLHAAALVAEQAGEPERAVSLLATTLDRGRGETTLAHQWTSELVRFALAAGDRATAQDAVRRCEAEAAAETRPARAAAALDRCAGLLHGDPAALRRAVEHYERIGPRVDLAGALEDLAVVLAERDEPEEAREVLGRALDAYTALDAVWDLKRAEQRLRRWGIRRGARGPRVRRPSSGWGALTPTEREIVDLVVEGRTTIAIAEKMYLSRRTVQTHVSSVLRKLGVRSRVEIARAVLDHQRSAAPEEDVG